jgi:hypothetical protein
VEALEPNTSAAPITITMRRFIEDPLTQVPTSFVSRVGNPLAVSANESATNDGFDVPCFHRSVAIAEQSVRTDESAGRPTITRQVARHPARGAEPDQICGAHSVISVRA